MLLATCSSFRPLEKIPQLSPSTGWLIPLGGVLKAIDNSPLSPGKVLKKLSD
jgi:hypothetical protein